MDVFSQEKRSKVMKKIKSKDTQPEMLVRRFLRQNGIGYKKNRADLPGKPDVACSRYRCAIFINGCFWHGHEDCKYYVVPKTRTEWWLAKIARNKANDNLNRERLASLGWRVMTLWECELKPASRELTLSKMLIDLKSQQLDPDPTPRKVLKHSPEECTEE